MGKPSSTSTSLSRSSECSIHLSSSKQKNKLAMSAHKMEQIRKKNHNHVKKNIKKLFNRLKQDSASSTDTTQDFSLDTTPRNLTVVVQNDSFTPQRKRNNPMAVTNVPSKCQKRNDSLIIVNDDDRSNDSCILFTNVPSKCQRQSNTSIIVHDEDVTTNNDSCILISPPRSNTHINCSTPIAQRNNQNLQNLIINNFPKTINNENCTQNNNKEINKTKVINKDSYLTIDLTADSENKSNTNVTVIDVENTVDCTNDMEDWLSMSGDSDVTVVQNNRNYKKKQINKFANGIAQLNSSEKGKLLELLANKLFGGCDLKNNIQTSLANIRKNRATETDEDAYIKEVILGESKTQETEVSHSRNSIGSNIYHPSTDVKNTTGLRMIVIDGSNVAMEHTKGRLFSVQGLKICIDYFLRRGHVVKAFVPRFRCKFGKSSDPNLLDNLERQGLVVYTPSREIQGKACVPYDDRYIIQCAAEFDGVVVSGDNYKDLIKENPRWRYIIENRVLPFTWVNNMIMFPKDPFGRGGPTLETLLRHPTPSNSRNENK